MAYDKLADAIIKHSKLIMVIWIVILLVAAVPAVKAFGNMSYDVNEMGIEESESMEGYGIIATYFPSSSADTSSSPILVIAYGNDDEHELAKEVDGIICDAVEEGSFTYTTVDGEEAIKIVSVNGMDTSDSNAREDGSGRTAFKNCSGTISLPSNMIGSMEVMPTFSRHFRWVR